MDLASVADGTHLTREGGCTRLETPPYRHAPIPPVGEASGSGNEEAHNCQKSATAEISFLKPSSFVIVSTDIYVPWDLLPKHTRPVKGMLLSVQMIPNVSGEIAF